MEEKKTGGNGLAIASFVLALIGGILCITVFLLPLGCLCLILALIFGIIALYKKQTKWASILGIIISIFWMVIVSICCKFVLKLRNEHKNEIITPITEFSERIEQNPEIATLMENDEFSDKYEEAIKQRLEEKYSNKFSNINDIDGIIDIFGDILKEIQNVATELAEQQGISANEEPVIEIDEEQALGIANPAAEFCVAQGGESYIVKDEDGAQKGMCRLSDGSEIDEWEYFNAIADVASDVVEGAENEVKVCGEFYKSGEEIVCTEQYAPVCGDDGKTYGNSCFACIEVDSYTDGECNAN